MQCQCGGKRAEYTKFPSLFDPDTDDEFSSESSSDPEGLTRAPPSLLHISVCHCILIKYYNA